MLLAAMLCIGLLCPACALASPGDAVLAYRDFDTGEGFADRILRGGVTGQELVLFGENALYT